MLIQSTIMMTTIFYYENMQDHLADSEAISCSSCKSPSMAKLTTPAAPALQVEEPRGRSVVGVESVGRHRKWCTPQAADMMKATPKAESRLRRRLPAQSSSSARYEVSITCKRTTLTRSTDADDDDSGAGDVRVEYRHS